MLTREAALALLAVRVGATLDAAGVPREPALDDALAGALAALGYPVASPAAADDAELAAVDPADARRVADLAEVRALETALNAAVALVEIAEDDYRERREKFAEALERKLARLLAGGAAGGAAGPGRLSVGLLDLDFAERGEG